MPNITIAPGTGSRRRYYPKYRIALGPWPGGINATAEPASLDSTELQQCVNFVTKSDGTLVTRPPVKALGALNATAFGLPAWNNVLVNYAELGSVIIGSALVPFMVATDTTDPAHEKTFYYKWNAGAGQFEQAWTTSDWGATAPPDWVRNVVWYNGKFYVATNAQAGQSKLYTSALSTGALAAVAGAPGADFFTHMLVHKDRMFLVTAPGTIYWSKATDPTTWAAPNGGSIRTGANDDDYIHTVKVFQDSLYIFKNRSIWRLSWLTDPGVDGTLSKIADTGGFDCEIYNNELYFVNSRGVYKLVGQYFVEISAKISPFFRRMTQNLGFPINKPRMGFGMYRIGTYLLVGPFSKALEYPVRYSGDAILSFPTTASDFYFVYSLDQQNWTTWEYSANHPTNPTGGPYGKPMTQNSLDLTEADNFIYVSNVAIVDLGSSAVGLNRMPYFVKADDLVVSPSNTNALGFDKGPNTTQPWEWIGGYFKTGAIDLGDASIFKRIFNTIVEAMCTGGTWDTNADAFKVELDSYAIPSMATPVGLIQSPAVPTTFTGWAKKLVLAKGYRARIFSLIYDSMTDIHLTPHSAGDSNGWPNGHFNFVKRVRFSVMLGRAQTTGTTEF